MTAKTTDQKQPTTTRHREPSQKGWLSHYYESHTPALTVRDFYGKRLRDGFRMIRGEKE